MTRRNILFLCLMSLAILFSACSTSDLDQALEEEQGLLEDEVATENQEVLDEIKPAVNKPTITGTTTFVTDIVKKLAGDYVDIELIIPAGEDPHTYEPKPHDLDKLVNSDLIIYQGLHFEGRMVDILEDMGYPITKDFPEDKIGIMDRDGDIVVDPHFWFDLDLYKMAVDNTADYLSDLLPDQAEIISSNAANYYLELDEMYIYCSEKMASLPEDDRFLITPHDAFNYFSRIFDIPVMAPQGINTDSEVANKDIQNTVDFIIENQIKAVFAETTTDPVRMEKLKEAAAAKGFEVQVVRGKENELLSDSLAPLGQKGDNYIDMFIHNVDLIVDNLK